VDTLRAAAVAWRIRQLRSVDGFLAHMAELLDLCDGADLVVMPENIGLELLSLCPEAAPWESGQATCSLLKDRWAEFGALAAEYRCTLVAGTYLVPCGDHWVNSALVAFPDGRFTLDVPKVVLTQYEAEEWGVVPGSGLRELPDPRIGVTVCYDCEFPESGRRLAEAGVLVQCVPAFTETRRGFQRVRWCCLARSVENQVFVVHSSLVGSLGREPVPSAVGSSAVIAPSVEPFPEQAVLAETPWNAEGAAVAELDFAELHRGRESGDVRNWNDRGKSSWPLTSCSLLP
jgi:predicted amidohydrolase